MIEKKARCLRIGVLGCGLIAQFAHLDACRKARNAELYAICDVAEDLLTRMAAIHQPQVIYRDYDEMLADPQVEAVIIAVADHYLSLLQQSKYQSPLILHSLTKAQVPTSVRFLQQKLAN